MSSLIFMVRLFLADVPDAVSSFIADRLPRRVAYWAAVRVTVHAASTLPTTEMDAITPSDVLRAWR